MHLLLHFFDFTSFHNYERYATQQGFSHRHWQKKNKTKKKQQQEQHKNPGAMGIKVNDMGYCKIDKNNAGLDGFIVS